MMSLKVTFQINTVCIVAIGSNDKQKMNTKMVKPKNLSISLNQKSANFRTVTAVQIPSCLVSDISNSLKKEYLMAVYISQSR